MAANLIEDIFALVTAQAKRHKVRIEDVQIDLMNDTIRVTALTSDMKPERLDIPRRGIENNNIAPRLREWLERIAPINRDETDGFVSCSHWGMFPKAA